MSRRRRAGLAAATSAALVLTLVAVAPAGATTGGPAQVDGSAAAAATPEALTAGTYIVALDAPPSTRYTGGLPGLAATAKGADFDVHSPQVTAYERHLREVQDELLEDVGAAVRVRYTTALNGFSVDLTAEQAATLASTPGVAALTPAGSVQLSGTGTTTDDAAPANSARTSSHTDVRSAAGSSSAAAPGAAPAAAVAPAGAGAGIVVGVIGTGIWPESESFAGAPLATTPGAAPYVTGTTEEGTSTAYVKADGRTFTGLCQRAPSWATPADAGWDTSDCNSKVIAARYWGYFGYPEQRPAYFADSEYASPRDGDGAGTHDASVAVGNRVSVPQDDGTARIVAGLAPDAKVSVYKACWRYRNSDEASCAYENLLAAVEQALFRDGVDVLHFPVEGYSRESTGELFESYLGGRSDNSIAVVAPSGDDGPAAGSVTHNNPGVTTVGASTTAWIESTVRTGDGQSFAGTARPPQSLPVRRVVPAEIGTEWNGEPYLKGNCAAGSLTSAARDAIILCRYDTATGDTAAQAREVARVGGAGLVLAGVGPQILRAAGHAVPTVGLGTGASDAVFAYALQAGDGATASFSAPRPLDPRFSTPRIAPFSARGPGIANQSDVLKPDVVAPGVDVLGAVPPALNGGRSYGERSGTGTAAATVSGLSALLLSRNPGWSKGQVKSALMTTATDLRTFDGGRPRDPFAQGAGQVDAARALDPGLLVELTGDEIEDMFFRQRSVAREDPGFNSSPTSTNNLPSIAVESLPESQELTRRFTALRTGAYVVRVDVPGFRAVYANRLDFTAVGQTKPLDVTFTRTSAPYDVWRTGFITLTGPRTVRIPVVLRAVPFQPPEIRLPAGSTGTRWKVEPGVDASGFGPLPSILRADAFAPGRRTTTTLPPGTTRTYDVRVPPGTRMVRFDLDVTAGAVSAEIRKLAFDGSFTLVPGFAGPGDARLDLVQPAGAVYRVALTGAAGTTTAGATFTSFVLPGNVRQLTYSQSPSSWQKRGEPTLIDARWGRLDPTTPWIALTEVWETNKRTVISIG